MLLDSHRYGEWADARLTSFDPPGPVVLGQVMEGRARELGLGFRVRLLVDEVDPGRHRVVLEVEPQARSGGLPQRCSSSPSRWELIAPSRITVSSSPGRSAITVDGSPPGARPPSSTPARPGRRAASVAVIAGG